MITALLNPGKRKKRGKKGGKAGRARSSKLIGRFLASKASGRKGKKTAWKKFSSDLMKKGYSMQDVGKAWKEMKGIRATSKATMSECLKSCRKSCKTSAIARPIEPDIEAPTYISEFSGGEEMKNRRRRHSSNRRGSRHARRGFLKNYYMVLKNDPISGAIASDLQTEGKFAMVKPKNLAAFVPYFAGYSLNVAITRTVTKYVPVPFLKAGVGNYVVGLASAVVSGMLVGKALGTNIGKKFGIGGMMQVGGSAIYDILAARKAAAAPKASTKGVYGIDDYASPAQVSRAPQLVTNMSNYPLPTPMPTVATQSSEAQAIADFDAETEMSFL